MSFLRIRIGFRCLALSTGLCFIREVDSVAAQEIQRVGLRVLLVLLLQFDAIAFQKVVQAFALEFVRAFFFEFNAVLVHEFSDAVACLGFGLLFVLLEAVVLDEAAEVLGFIVLVVLVPGAALAVPGVLRGADGTAQVAAIFEIIVHVRSFALHRSRRRRFFAHRRCFVYSDIFSGLLGDVAQTEVMNGRLLAVLLFVLLSGYFFDLVFVVAFDVDGAG